MPLSRVVDENWRGFGGRMSRRWPWNLARLLAAMSAKTKSQNSAESVQFAWIFVMVCFIFVASDIVLSLLLFQRVFYLRYFRWCSTFATSGGVLSSLIQRCFIYLCYLRGCSIFVTSEGFLRYRSRFILCFK